MTIHEALEAATEPTAETPEEQIARLTRERGEAREMAKKAHAHRVEALNERDEARAEAERLRGWIECADPTTPKPGEVSEIARQRAELAQLRDHFLEACSDATNLRERLGYYERGNVPRLLGIAPEQLAAVGRVLRWAEARRETGVTLYACIELWIAAGRPLAGGE